MFENQTCESALIDICTKFLLHLNEMKQKGLISNVEYEVHSRMKEEFLNQVTKARLS